MALRLHDLTVLGPALPESFVRLELEAKLSKLELLSKATGPEGRELQDRWDSVRKKLRQLSEHAGAVKVFNHAVAPLGAELGYPIAERAPNEATREGTEDGGWLLRSANGAHHLRAWTVEAGTDLDAPNRRGRAYRFSPSRVAHRVLLAKSERLGLISDGQELRLVIADPARPESHLIIRLDRSGGWRSAREVPDSYRVVQALARPEGVGKLPDLLEAARLEQTKVTDSLRLQARQAVEGFLQHVLDHPGNRDALTEAGDRQELARTLWREGLIVVYRLLFVLKLEASSDPARAFSFASTSLWRSTYSPNVALGRWVRAIVDDGAETGHLLEHGLRSLFRLFSQGLKAKGLTVSPLGGMLFGDEAIATLNRLEWGEHAVAHLLDRILWTPRGREERQRVHYGSLDVEDLGRVYEALLELDPGISEAPMCRLRRNKLEVVVPAAQGEMYREGGGTKRQVQWIEAIPPDRFYLRVGLGRKTSGSYYTPHPFVRFLVEETLGPQVEERSPLHDPNPAAILDLDVLDPAMGSGHFLVEACRYLGEKLYEACRLCDERAAEARAKAERAKNEAERTEHEAHEQAYIARVAALPDPDDELVAYLPSRAPEGAASGLSQWKAEALCRRLVAVHCLYGVDKNPLAVELAKVSLWLESYAEGLPLTFLDHRLVQGDSLTGPMFAHLASYPVSGEPIDGLFVQQIAGRLEEARAKAVAEVTDLEESVGTDVDDLERKRGAKARLDAALAPFVRLARVWSGAAQTGTREADVAYETAVARVIADVDLAEQMSLSPDTKGGSSALTRLGAEAVSFDLAFPEVFSAQPPGFDSIIGNPPWDKVRIERRDLVATVDASFLSGKEQAGAGDEHERLLEVFSRNQSLMLAESAAAGLRRLASGMLSVPNACTTRRPARSDPDLYQLFCVRALDLIRQGGSLGFITGGGLAKNPADEALRTHLVVGHHTRLFLHFVNLGQLFGGASSRISFVVLHTVKVEPADEALVRFATELDSFVQVSDPRILSSLDVLTVANAKERLRRAGTLVQQEGEPPKDWMSAAEGVESMGLSVGSDLHRTAAKQFLVPLQDVLPESDDARIPSTYATLNTMGWWPVFDGKSISNYTAFQRKKSGKWDPRVVFVASSKAESLARLRRRSEHYRLAWRATCGHPRTNARSARACILPPACVATDSVRLEVLPWERDARCALLVCAVVNSFSFDSRARPHIGSNLNKSVMQQFAWPREASPMVSDFLADVALRLVSENLLFAELWESVSGRAFEVLPRDVVDARLTLLSAADGVVGHLYDDSYHVYASRLEAFRARNDSALIDACLDAYCRIELEGLEDYCSQRDPLETFRSSQWMQPEDLSPEVRKSVVGYEISKQLAGLGLSTAAEIGARSGFAVREIEEGLGDLVSEGVVERHSRDERIFYCVRKS